MQYCICMRSAADRGEYRQVAGAIAEAVIRSVGLIVQPAAQKKPPHSEECGG
jgi:hypothetical protein